MTDRLGGPVLWWELAAAGIWLIVAGLGATVAAGAGMPAPPITAEMPRTIHSR